jgi:hypothetical protein
MRRLLIVLLVLAVIVVGLGFYLDWLEVSTSQDATGKTDIKVTIDPSKVKSDFERAGQAIQEAVGQAR